MTVLLSVVASCSDPLPGAPARLHRTESPLLLTSTVDFATAGNEEGGVGVTLDRVVRRDVRVAGLGPDSAGPQMATPRFHHGTVAYRGRLYVFGGCRVQSLPGECAAADILDGAESAVIGADGSLGSFSAQPALPQPRYRFAFALYSGVVYAAGGHASPGARSDVIYSRIQPDGALGPWLTGPSLGSGKDAAAMVAYSGHLYLLGGEYVSEVLYSAINPDGSLGTWTPTASMLTPRAYFGAVAYNGHLYAIGGWNTGAGRAEVEYARIRSEGSLEPFQALPPLPGVRALAVTFAHDGHLYALGGGNNTGMQTDAVAAVIRANGTLGPWNTLRAYTGHREVGATYEGRVYVTGGVVGAVLAGSKSAAIEGSSPATGDASGWRSAGQLVSPRMHHASVVHGDRLYVLGGCTSGLVGGACTAYSTETQTAPFLPDGTLGDFTLSPTTFQTGRHRAGAVAYGGRLYLLGGRNAGGVLGDVQHARINPDGTLGAFAVSPHLFTPRSSHSALAHGGFLYVFGGNGPGHLATIQMSRVDPSTGEPGPWALAGTLLRARTEGAAVAYAGHLYVLAGWDGSAIADVEVAPFLSDGSLGAFTSLPLPFGRAIHGGAAMNGYLYLACGADGVGLDPTIPPDLSFAPLLSGGGIGPWTRSPNTVPVPRLRHDAVAHGGNLYLVGGISPAGVLLDGVQVATLEAPWAGGVYSRLIDLGRDSTPTGLVVRGTSGLSGTVQVAYRAAPASAASTGFGPLVDLGVVPLDQVVPPGIADARHVWLRLQLDDSRAAVGDPASERRDVTELELLGLEPQHFRVGCACGQGGSPLAGLVLLAAIVVRRPGARTSGPRRLGWTLKSERASGSC